MLCEVPNYVKLSLPWPHFPLVFLVLVKGRVFHARILPDPSSFLPEKSPHKPRSAKEIRLTAARRNIAY